MTSTQGHVFPSPDGVSLPAITTQQMIEVDRLMMRHYHIELLQMMELAGRNLAFLANKLFLSEAPTRPSVLVLAGKGGNGGGALVAARRLANWGVTVHVQATHPLEQFSPAAAHQWQTLEKMGIDIVVGRSDNKHIFPTLIIDGIIGYSLAGKPRGEAARLIDWANEQADVPVLSLDVPSGFDSAMGTGSDTTLRATATMTLALPKIGLLDEKNRLFVGELFVADIGVPPALYAFPTLNLTVPPLFAHGEILRL